MSEQENKLEIIVKESGLEPAKGQMLLDKFSNYFRLADEWDKKAKTLVVTNENQTAEMDMARTGRLFLRDKRIAIEKARKELKEQALREGKAIDGIANILKALIVPIEEYLEQQEKFVEIREAKKAEQLRIEVEKRIEEERIAKEKAEAEERERIKIENEKLKAEAVEREKKAEAERQKQEAVLAAEKAKAEAEKKAAEEKHRKEQEAKDKMARLEKEKLEKELIKQKLESEKKAKAKLEAEKKKREKLLKIIESPIECPHCHKTFKLNQD